MDSVVLCAAKNVNISTINPVRRWSPRARSIAVRALTACAVLNIAIAIWDLTAGGFYFQVLGLRISSWEADKPLRSALVCATAAAWLHDRVAAPNRTTSAWLDRTARSLALLFVVAWTLAAMRYTSHAVGGADTYGYVSEAALWMTGRLVVHEPLAELAPLLGRAVAPLGYQLATVPGAIVPTYPPGLPLMMALAMKITGAADAVYLIVPLAGGVAIWLTYLLGARLAGRVAGLLAALLTGLSPTFIFQSLHAMSDVPATMWWLLAWTLAWPTGRRLPLVAGLAASMAVLTRPNLVPLAVVIAGLVALERPRLFRVTAFSIGMLPSCFIIAALNAHLYGSPLSSGYGSLQSLYTWSNFVPNVRNYTAWFFDLHSPVALLALAAPWIVHSRRAWLMLAFSAGVLCSYLFYFVFDRWTFLRLLLPAIPIVFVLTGAVAVWLVGRLPVHLRGAAVLIVLLPCWYELHAQHFDPLNEGRTEDRYVVIGEFLNRTLPQHAVVMSLNESGSVRLYGHRKTVRWDLLGDDRLDSTVDILRANGFAPYILIEPWEETQFSHFARANIYGRLDWPPAIVVRGPVAPRIYSADDRDRFFAGEEIHPAILQER
ncbi:MAG TPA: glycosyltransferase family 39 protein [Vicinamibacterales bacterium]|jgi:hypothetical protein